MIPVLAPRKPQPENVTMLVGYVSDENYVAIPDALLEFEQGGQSWEARSRATGAVYVELPPGLYRVTLSKPGFGSKRTQVTVHENTPHHFRLLSDRLLGYPWPKWVRSGEQSEFRVHSPEQYHLSLWRYGWHKELIRELGWFDEHGPRTTVQVLPDGDFTQTGVQWNKQGYSNSVHAQKVTAPERTGLYYFHARTPSGLFCSFPWIVAPAKPHARIAVILSNITWNAYNNFGGRSNYINADRLLPVPTINSRQDLPRYAGGDSNTYSSWTYDPLSFDRPEIINHVPESDQVTDPIEGRTACHLAPAEWRLLGWLEREGIPHDVYAETQLHSAALRLDDYQQVILGPHPEYWSRTMYFDLKAWIHERGGKLLYLGGNGLNCEVDFVDDQTIVVQNGDERDRISKATHESRFATRVESEANLLGIIFDYEGIMTSAPFRVTNAHHWAFAETNLKDGDLFGHKSLHKRCPGGASGHETDKVSPHSPPQVVKLAKGQNPGNNGGADMTIYETPSGGAVFATGSITWCSSLLVDDAVSQITLNVLRHFEQS